MSFKKKLLWLIISIVAISFVGITWYYSFLRHPPLTEVYGYWEEQLDKTVPYLYTDYFEINEQGLSKDNRLLTKEIEYTGKTLRYQYQNEIYFYQKDKLTGNLIRMEPSHYQSEFKRINKDNQKKFILKQLPDNMDAPPWSEH